MKAGRELDALIAEKVMGWEAVNDELEIAKREGNPDLVDSQRWHRRKVWFKGNEKMACEECGTLPAYSTDIADAWEVVRKMGMVLIENSGEAFGKLDEWNVQFVGHDKEGEPHWVSESAETVELAICLAALKAKEVTGEQHG